MMKFKSLTGEEKIEYNFLVLAFNILVFYAFAFGVFGALMNMSVVAHNDGRMPVYTNCSYDTNTHFNFQNFDEVTYPYLTDIIKVINPFGYSYAFISIGDVSIFFSIFLGISSVIWFQLKGYKFRKRVKKKYGNR